jgi:hypothetical protein
MLKKEIILNTAVLYFDPKDECFVVESPLCDEVIAAAETKEEACQLFVEFLNDTYVDYLEGKLAGYQQPGRPSKDGATLHTRVKPATKDRLDKLSSQLGISLGELVDHLLFFYDARTNEDTYEKRINPVAYVESRKIKKLPIGGRLKDRSRSRIKKRVASR